MRRKISILMCIVLLAALFVQTTAFAVPEGATLTVSSDTCKQGESVALEVTLTDNSGIMFLSFTPTCYDSENNKVNYLTVAVTNGDLYSITNGKNPVFDSDSDVTENGKLCTLNITVAETTPVGVYTVKLISRGCYNSNEQDVGLNIVAGTVTVEAVPVSATGITLNKATLSINTGASEPLTATVSPDNATNKAVTWKSSDDTVATVDENGNVTGVKKGTATITVTTADGGFTDTCDVTVECAHTNTTDVPAEVSTCQKQGNDAYTKCDDCGEVISGSDAKLPLDSCNFIEKAEGEYLVSAANCTDKAVYYKSCSVCGSKDIVTFEYGEVDSANHHGGTYLLNQEEASCYKEGYTGDKYCSSCDTLLENGTVIGKGAHTPSSVWSTDEDNHWKECTTVGCGIVIETTKEPHKDGEATCVSKAVCSVCGIPYGTIDSDNHKNTEVRGAVEATEDNMGYTGDTWCLDCDTQIGTGSDIDKLEHIIEKVDAKEATCTEEGNIEYYICYSCDRVYEDAEGINEITLDDTVIETIDHSYGGDWEADQDNHWHECECGDKIDVEAHDIEIINSKAATADEKGYTGDKVCKICEYVIEEGEDISAMGSETEASTEGNGSSKPADTPQTGDMSRSVLWIVLSFISCDVVITTVTYKKRVK